MTKRPDHQLGEALGDAFDDRELSDGLVRIERRLHRRKVTRRIGAGALVGAAAVALFLLSSWPGDPEAPIAHERASTDASGADALVSETGQDAMELAPLRLSDGRPLRALAEERQRVAFADGSRIDLDPETRLRSRAGPADEVRLVLDRGQARFDIQPGGPRRWTIEAGPVRVEVLGTAFTVTREGDSVQVEVHRGLVAVTTATDTRRLRAGERLAIASPETSAAARDGRQPGGSDQSARRQATLSSLVERADAARAAGEVERAVELLQRIVRSYPRSREAPSAAITWARLEERRGDAAAAERAYERCISLRPPTALLSLSYDRLIRLRMARHARAEAEEALIRFRTQAPGSDRLPALERLVGP